MDNQDLYFILRIRIVYFVIIIGTEIYKVSSGKLSYSSKVPASNTIVSPSILERTVKMVLPIPSSSDVEQQPTVFWNAVVSPE